MRIEKISDLILLAFRHPDSSRRYQPHSNATKTISALASIAKLASTYNEQYNKQGRWKEAEEVGAGSSVSREVSSPEQISILVV